MSLPACPCLSLPVPARQHVVFVWDFDEVLVPLHSLITGQYAQLTQAAEEDAAQLADLGRQLQGLVLQLADQKLHFKEVRGPGGGGGGGATGGRGT